MITMTVFKKNIRNEWEAVTTTARRSGAVEFARMMLPILYDTLSVDDEDMEYFENEFNEQANGDGEIYIDNLIWVK